MTKFRKLVALSILACFGVTDLMALETCGVASFGTESVGICDRRKEECLGKSVPPEIRNIEVGLLTEYVGYFVNDGRASWHGIDFISNKQIVVERYAGRRINEAPKVANPTRADYVRELNEGGLHWFDHVVISDLEAQRASQLICLSNPLWAEPKNLLKNISDMSQKVLLIRTDAVRSHGSGGVREKAEEVWLEINK